MLLRALLLVLPVMPAADITPSFTIQTAAGTDFVGDGGGATSAILSQPEGVAIDATGNLYIADADDNRIRVIAPDGTIRTLAGNGLAGFSGDGGPAASAQLAHPYGLALDRAGNLYVADLGNARIRQLTPDGKISTVAGGGSIVPGTGNSTTSGTAVKLDAPRNVAVDAAGNLFISDFGANQVYQVSSSGVFSIVAGTGSAGFSGDGGAAELAQLAAPAGLVVDNGGNLYFADSANNCIREVGHGTISTVFSITAPTGVALGSSGALYVAAAGYFGTIAQSLGGGLTARDVTADAAGNLYLTGGAFVQRLAVDGSVSIIAGSGAARYYGGDGGPATQARLHTPSGVALDDLGDAYLADTGNNRIRKVMANGLMTTFAGTGDAGSSDGQGSAMAAQFSAPRGVALDSQRNLYVADSGNNRVCKIAQNGTLSVVADQLNDPEAVAVDGNDTLYIADTGNNRVLQVTAAAAAVVAGEYLKPAGLAVDRSGTLYISESTRVSKISSGGTLSTVAGGLLQPSGLAVLPDGSLLIAETGNQRILLVTGGAPSILAGAGIAGFSGDGGDAQLAELNAPQGLGVDPQGRIWIADSANQRMRTLTPAAPLTTPATSISLLNAASLAAGSIAPGELVTIYGSGFDPGRTQLLFDGQPATLLYTNTTQVNALAPALTPGTDSVVTLLVDGSSVAAAQVSVVAAAPALFAGSNGTGQAAALNLDGTVNSAVNPAHRGSYVSLYATGFNTATVTVTIAGYQAVIQYAGPAPGLPGLRQINVQIPAGFLPPGIQPVVLTVGGTSSQSGVTLAIE